MSLMKTGGDAVASTMEKILFLLQARPMIPWEELFADERKRRGIIACFLAMLELTKLQKIFIRQDGTFGKISIFKKDENAVDEAPIAETLIAEALASQAAAPEAAPIETPLESHAEPDPVEPPKAEPEGETDVQP